jgi:hypothetical protein
VRQYWYALELRSDWYGLQGAVVRTVLGLVCGMGSAAVFWAVAVCGTIPELAESGDS